MFRNLRNFAQPVIRNTMPLLWYTCTAPVSATYHKCLQCLKTWRNGKKGELRISKYLSFWKQKEVQNKDKNGKGKTVRREKEEFLNLGSYFHHLNVSDLTRREKNTPRFKWECRNKFYLENEEIRFLLLPSIYMTVGK